MSDAALRMDRMYRWQRHIYDATRKHYLLGRDRIIAGLDAKPGMRVLEIGCGTGRNLVKAAQAWPQARFYGFDVSQEMLVTAQANVGRAGLSAKIMLAQGDATDFDTAVMFGEPLFDRIMISYVVSMIPDWRETLALAADHLAPGGHLLIADFGMGTALPAPVRAGISRWLAIFSVTPRQDLEQAVGRLAAQRGHVARFERLYRDYAVSARIEAAA